MPYIFRKSSLLASLVAGALVACVSAGDGVQPPPGRVYFPVGLAVSRTADHLLIVNSDFDLQFAQGTIQSLDLERVREVTSHPCTSDTECAGDEICDLDPSDENGGHPSYVCVDSSDPRPCGRFGEKRAQVRAVAVGRCAPIDLENPADGGRSLLSDVAETSAFATQGLLVSRPCGTADAPFVCPDDASAEDRVAGRGGETYPDRLFVPIRGDTAIHYVDIDEEGQIICGRPVERESGLSYRDAESYDLRCDDKHRVSRGVTYGLDGDGNLVETKEPPIPGDEVEEDIDDDDPLYDFRVQPEPIEIGASATGRVVVVSHQTDGVVSTLMNNWLDRPNLIHVLRDLQYSPLGVAAVESEPHVDGTFPDDSSADFLLTYRGDAQIDLLHFEDDGLLEASTTTNVGDGAAREVFRPRLVPSASTIISTNTSGIHSRGLLVSARARNAALSECDADEASCVEEAKTASLDVYVTNRSPNSLLLGRTGGTRRVPNSDSLPRIFDNLPLTAGPSRVVRGPVRLRDGTSEERIFVICFDDALIYVYDPVRRVVESEIRTGRGPYAMAFDPVSPLVYVAHFTDSYIGVVSLDQQHLRTYGATLATLGIPAPPRATED